MTKKIDAGYIAGLEKAVAEKYGKDAVQDFREEWQEDKEKKYLNQLKERENSLSNKEARKEIITEGDFVFKSRRKQETVDRTCPVCKTYSFSAQDDLYMNRFKACRLCYFDFIYAREEEWTSGKRPTQKDINICLRRRK